MQEHLLDKFEEHRINEIFDPERVNTCGDV